MPAHSSDSVDCNTNTAQPSVQDLSTMPLPVRTGPRIKTSGKVPHVQRNVTANDAINTELHRLAFSLPGLEKRPTIVSISGSGMWLANSVPVAQPKAIIAGREFAHIHRDGSLHAPLPLARALELEKKGWGERHPWADRNEGWEGLVMLYSASNEEELKILTQLVTESYNYVTGQSAKPAAC